MERSEAVAGITALAEKLIVDRLVGAESYPEAAQEASDQEAQEAAVTEAGPGGPWVGLEGSFSAGSPEEGPAGEGSAGVGSSGEASPWEGSTRAGSEGCGPGEGFSPGVLRGVLLDEGLGQGGPIGVCQEKLEESGAVLVVSAGDETGVGLAVGLLGEGGPAREGGGNGNGLGVQLGAGNGGAVNGNGLGWVEASQESFGDQLRQRASFESRR